MSLLRRMVVGEASDEALEAAAQLFLQAGGHVSLVEFSMLDAGERLALAKAGVAVDYERMGRMVRRWRLETGTDDQSLSDMAADELAEVASSMVSGVEE